MVSVQLLSELEEIIQCLVRPEKKKQLQKTWWNRLLVSAILTCTCTGKFSWPKKCTSYKKNFKKRYSHDSSFFISHQGCQRNMEDWQRILQVRSLVLSQQEELKSWIKFASICRKSGKLVLSERTLITLLSNDQSFNIDTDPLSVKFPQVCLTNFFISKKINSVHVCTCNVCMYVHVVMFTCVYKFGIFIIIFCIAFNLHVHCL